MKIFYKTIEDVDEMERLLKDPAVEDITLDTQALRRLVEELVNSNYGLPESLRMFQDWRVGFLGRYDPEFEERSWPVSPCPE